MTLIKKTNGSEKSSESITDVKRLFSKPPKINGSQFFRREISSRMFEKLQIIKKNPNIILDAGCGEADDLIKFIKMYPKFTFLGVDCSEEMLKIARKKIIRYKLFNFFRKSKNNLYLSCTDFANLSVTHSSIDLIWSNLAIHWHQEPHFVIKEWSRVLKKDGVLMFCCFGPDTFSPLRAIFKKYGLEKSFITFLDMHDYGDILLSNGFENPVMDMEKINLTYISSEKLINDVRAFGGNLSKNRSKFLLGKKKWESILFEIESSRKNDGLIHLDMEVIYGHAFYPQKAPTSFNESVIRLDMKYR